MSGFPHVGGTRVLLPRLSSESLERALKLALDSSEDCFAAFAKSKDCLVKPSPDWSTRKPREMAA